jgi:hypothetical protein
MASFMMQNPSRRVAGLLVLGQVVIVVLGALVLTAEYSTG